jgi:hypothetical protein
MGADRAPIDKVEFDTEVPPGFGSTTRRRAAASQCAVKKHSKTPA